MLRMSAVPREQLLIPGAGINILLKTRGAETIRNIFVCGKTFKESVQLSWAAEARAAHLTNGHKLNNTDPNGYELNNTDPN